jgi:RND family efflux transporter MFP subunit
MTAQWLYRTAVFAWLAFHSLTAVLLAAPPGSTGEFDCLIEPSIMAKVSSAVKGLVETMTVDRGDLVKKGQVLATLESNAEKAAIETLRARATMDASIKAGAARVELSTRSHTRNEGMFQRSLIPADKMDEVETVKRLAEMALLEATETRRLAELELQRALADLERRTVRSPFNGVVIERLLTVGEYANEVPLLKLVQLDPLFVEVFVPVEQYGQIVVGQYAEVMPQAPIQGTYRARVTVVNPVIDAASSTFGVRLELANRDYRLPAGLKCSIRFLPDKAPHPPVARGPLDAPKIR